MTEIDTHNRIITFGKHKGERWTRLPVSYLRWLSNESTGEARLWAEAELKRRGTTTPSDVELSGHAIDRASQITDEWKERGVHSWLTEVAGIAYTFTEKSEGEEVVIHNGYKFAFKHGNHYPILKTIISKKRKGPAPNAEALGVEDQVLRSPH